MLGDAISAKKSSGEASESLEIVDVATLLARSVAPAASSAAPGGSKNQTFMLKEAKPKDNPVEFTLELTDTKEQVAVSKDKPYATVAGFTASLKYGPENLAFLDKRVGDSLVFAGDTNKIVAITETNVTVAAASNTKRTTVAYTPTP